MGSNNCLLKDMLILKTLQSILRYPLRTPFPFFISFMGYNWIYSPFHNSPPLFSVQYIYNNLTMQLSVFGVLERNPNH